MIDDTLLIFTSDNGPVWYAEDIERFGHDSVGGLRGMKGDAWEGGHRMPFIARWPGRAAPGSTSDQIISFTDLLATFAEITGTALPDGTGGFSRPSIIRPGPGDPTGQLYDLEADPSETHNLYAEHPEIVERLRYKMRRIIESDTGGK